MRGSICSLSHKEKRNMIYRLKLKNSLDIYYLVNEVKDKYEDFYITKDRERIFLKDLNIIKKIVKHQEIYGIFDNDLKAIMMIYREKGFRPYLKILSKSKKYIYNLLSYLFWNFNEEIFIKLKKENPLATTISRFRIHRKLGFKFAGNRGTEILFKKIKEETNNGYHNSKS